MREIKFRGIELESGNWVYGSFLNFDPIPEIQETDFDEGAYDYQRWEVKLETVGQFTGLTDKNGKEIYEGDIINLHIFVEEMGANYGVSEGEREYIGFICFEELGLAFKRTADDEDWFYLVYTPGMLHEESFDLLGNIHDNPELLKP